MTFLGLADPQLSIKGWFDAALIDPVFWFDPDWPAAPIRHGAGVSSGEGLSRADPGNLSYGTGLGTP